MKLTADERGSLVNSQLFPPKTTFEATVESDGSIRLVEITQKPSAVVKPRRINGRLRGADVQLNPETVASAVRADRDSR